MPWPLRRLSFEQIVPIVLGAAVFAFACGSSSIMRVQQAGRPARWVLLFLLFALAIAWSVGERGRPRLPAPAIAVAAALSALALVSTLWSVDPRLSFERAGTFAAMFATVGAIAHASAGLRGAADRVLAGMVGGAGAVAIAGLFVLVIRHADAVEPATRDLPARYQGLGENPNTVPLLLAPCLGLAVWLFIRARSRRARIALAALALLFDGSMIASGSRGSLIAGFAGVALVVLLAPVRIRVRAALTAATVLVLAASIGIALAPKSKGAAWRPPPIAHSPALGAHPKPGYTDVQGAFPLDSDMGVQLGQSKQVTRTLFGLTGRGEAWRGAIDLGNERPLLGYAFGTEGLVFVDRWVNFVGGLPENSYIGTYLQLGAVGLLALVALIAALVLAAVRRPSRWEMAGPLAAFTAGLILACVQSYLYSVGSIATLVVWTAAFLAAARPATERARA